MSKQHEFSIVNDNPGALDRSLKVLSARGVRVLDFWRNGGNWVFNTMVRNARKAERA